MAVKGSGSLSFSEIAAEFGDSAPHSLSEFYGGGIVPAGANPSVPASGQIRFQNFYNSVAATVLNITSNTNNYDIGAAAIAAGGDKNTPVILTINAGVTVGSTSSSTPAMYTGTGWGAGTTINITNNGSITGASGSNTQGSTGAGGSGGYGGNCAGGTRYAGSGGAGSNGTTGTGQNGGNGFEHSQTGDNNLSVIFDTAGTRSGGSAGTYTAPGGGGGGGGGGARWWDICYCGGSGGGGAGYGSGGTSSGGCTGSGPGADGTSTTGGAGSVAGGTYPANGGNGGNGGNTGSSGSAGQAGGYWAGGGGAGGSQYQHTGTAGSALSGNTGQIS